MKSTLSLILLAAWMLLGAAVHATGDHDHEFLPRKHPEPIDPLDVPAPTNPMDSVPIPNCYLVRIKGNGAIKGIKKDVNSQFAAHYTQADIESKKWGITDVSTSGKWKEMIIRAPRDVISGVRSKYQSYIVNMYQDMTVVAHASQVVSATAQWHLPRVNQRDQASGGTTFYYPNAAGSNVVIYVFGTGVNVGHTDFGGRATWGGTWCSMASCPNSDDSGYGTHEASVAAGATYGYAKNAKIVALKVLDSTGTGAWSDCMTAMNWAIPDCQSRGTSTKCIFLMPMGSGYYQPINDAVTNAYNAGILVVTAAGNTNGGDSCTRSPGSSPSALNAGATTSSGTAATYSSIGGCINLWAPGSSVRGANNLTTTSTYSLSGTSNSASVVAGVAALEWSRNPSLSNVQLSSLLMNQATVYSSFDTTVYPNNFVYTNQ